MSSCGGHDEHDHKHVDHNKSSLMYRMKKNEGETIGVNESDLNVLCLGLIALVSLSKSRAVSLSLRM